MHTVVLCHTCATPFALPFFELLPALSDFPSSFLSELLFSALSVLGFFFSGL